MEAYMLSQLLSGNFTIQTIIAEILAVLVIIFLILPFHEWAHAQTAYLLGDKGIKQRGRLSLNPLSHIDPVGALAMLFIGFGWAKPVPVDARYFKNPKVGMAITAFMGPVANLIAALAGLFVFHTLWCIVPTFFTAGGFGSYVLAFLQFYIIVNVNLAVFNLLPIPPLDGSKILFVFLPDKAVMFFYRYQMFFMIGLIVLLWAGPLSYVLTFLSRGALYGIYQFSTLPFRLFGQSTVPFNAIF
ncbi:MAG: site-2 protease family protein [Ruminococcus sp.]|jgi:Zn-dependent protease|nr:site-2 protease family protein [Ruminococcus sp.]MBQ2538158.1 site-2 protease family protein [Ruminococcus sp.]MBQ4172676.1 site-2 protease family protein [Ruminococcus sp.]MBQ5631085.1 site-2 protease family protein [Ruminococcus sp.]